jgi:Type II secretion system (T2SS), protein G
VDRGSASACRHAVTHRYIHMIQVSPPLKHALGLTLITCLVIGALWAIYRSRTGGSGQLDKYEVTVDRLDSLAQACESYRKLVGAWPANVMLLRTAIQVKDTNILVDAWGHEIAFITPINPPGVMGVMWLKSFGADGISNGVGMDADIFYQLP